MQRLSLRLICFVFLFLHSNNQQIERSPSDGKMNLKSYSDCEQQNVHNDVHRPI